MMEFLQEKAVRALRWSERYTKTDMIYLAQTGFWMNLGTLLLAFASFLLYIVFAHALPKETYGTYQYFLSLSALLASLTLTGMNYAVTQAVARGFPGSLRASVELQLRFGLLPLSAAVLGALYYFYNGNTLIAEALLLMGLLVPLMSAYNTFGAYLVGEKNFKDQFTYSMAVYLPTYGLLALTAILLPNPFALLIVNLGVQTAIIFVIYRRVQRVLREAATDGEANRYGMQLSALNFFGAAVGQIDSVLAFHYLGPVQLALYSFATAIPDRAGGLLKFIYTAALPNFANRASAEIRETLLHKVLWTAFLALIAAGCYALIAPLIFTIFFPQYIESIPFSQLYSLTMLSYATNILVTAIISQRFVREFAIFNISSSLIQTLLQFAGIILFGLWGLIVGKILSNIVSGLIAGALFMLRRDPMPAEGAN